MSESVLSAVQQACVLEVAEAALRYALRTGEPMPVDLADYPQCRMVGASFVTLERNGQLRGCIGTLQPRCALLQDVANNACAAALRDPRFPAMRPMEISGLEITVSVLTPSSVLKCSNEAALLAQLRVGVDGLILESGSHRATFLPSVWEQLPDPVEFVRQLKRKAGLPVDGWPDNMRAYRYTTQSMSKVLAAD